MKILQISDSFGAAGGMERFIYEFSERLLSRGHETTIAAAEIGSTEAWGSDSFDTFQFKNDIHRWCSYVEQFKPDLVVWHVGGLSARMAAEVLKRRHPTVSTVHGVMCPSGVRLFRDRDEVCTVASGANCTIRWYSRRCGTSKSPVAALESLMNHKQVMHALRQCTRIYAVSKSVRTFLQIEGVRSEIVRVFDNTLGKASSSPLESSVHDHHVKLLYAGRLVYEKGVQYLIQAVRHLIDQGLHVECTIVGDGWFRGRLEDLTANLSLRNQITFQGNVAGQVIKDWYKWSDIVVIPSIWPDPAPLVVPEARAEGKPVVVTDVGGLPEWAELMNGIYVSRAADVASLAGQIEKLICMGAYSASPPLEVDGRVDILQDITYILDSAFIRERVYPYV